MEPFVVAGRGRVWRFADYIVPCIGEGIVRRFRIARATVYWHGLKAEVIAPSIWLIRDSL